MKQNNYMNVTSTTKEDLQILLEALCEISPKLDLFAIGGTAMVLDGIKFVTKDIDFVTDSSENKIEKLFQSAGLKKEKNFRYRWTTPNNIKIDIFCDGTIQGTPLSDDFKELSKRLDSFKKITLWRLNWYDIIINKMDRGENRDFEDIKMILEKEDLDLEFLIDRFLEVAETGIIANKHRKALDLIELKFKEWKFPINKKLIGKIKSDKNGL